MGTPNRHGVKVVLPQNRTQRCLFGQSPEIFCKICIKTDLLWYTKARKLCVQPSSSLFFAWNVNFCTIPRTDSWFYVWKGKKVTDCGYCGEKHELEKGWHREVTAAISQSSSPSTSYGGAEIRDLLASATRCLPTYLCTVFKGKKLIPGMIFFAERWGKRRGDETHERKNRVMMAVGRTGEGRCPNTGYGKVVHQETGWREPERGGMGCREVWKMPVDLVCAKPGWATLCVSFRRSFSPPGDPQSPASPGTEPRNDSPCRAMALLWKKKKKRKYLIQQQLQAYLGHLVLLDQICIAEGLA